MFRTLSEDLKNPDLFHENRAGEYVYGENSTGGKTASGALRLDEEAARDNKAQAAAGGESRRSSDHEWGADDGGHLIGARFGGETGEENLTAQNRNLNRSDYKRMENEWAAHLEAGDKVFVHIETDGAQRPDAYMGYVIYEAPDGTRDYDVFHMINESRAQVEQWNAELEEFERAEMESSQQAADYMPEEFVPEQEDFTALLSDYLSEETVSAEEGQTADAYLGDAASVETGTETGQSNESGMDSDSGMGSDSSMDRD